MRDKKFDIFKAKLLRKLGITKDIPLTKYEKMWILLCKGQLEEKYPFPKEGGWIERLKAPYEEIYGWSPEEYYNDFLMCMFNKLLEIHLKIKDDRSGSNLQLRNIFYASFSKQLSRTQELPIERAIAELCAEIQNTRYLKNGVRRYDLDNVEQITE